jgi:hypothetical protein
MRMGDQVMLKFDSQADPKDDAGNPIAVMMRKLVGAKVRILTDAAGKIEKIEGAKELKEKLAADGPPQLQMMTEGMLSEDAIRQMGVIPMFLPEKPVKTGDRWPYQAEFNLGPMGTLQVVMNWTARGWDSHDQKKCIRLTNTGTISSKAGSSTNAAMSLTVTSGDSTGQCWFDPELGMVVDSVADQKLSLKVAAMGQNLNMVMQQAVTNRVVEVTQAPK